MQGIQYSDISLYWIHDPYIERADASQDLTTHQDELFCDHSCASEWADSRSASDTHRDAHAREEAGGSCPSRARKVVLQDIEDSQGQCIDGRSPRSCPSCKSLSADSPRIQEG